MDKRPTLKVNETFEEIPKDCKQNNSKVFILFDDNGVERAEGMIHTPDQESENLFIEMGNEAKIIPGTIKVVNEYFDRLYSES